VTFSAWLFALSTIISWCYYGESGIVWLGGRKLVPLYRLFYSGLVLLATMPFIGVSEIDTLSVFGNGMMIWGNIPIMLIFAPYALRAFADYKRRLRAGEFDSN
jgi:AGCS family alanine or glycine:cation symporter